MKTREEYNAYCKAKNTERRERRKAAGQCYECGKPLPDGWKPGTRCAACREKQNRYHRERYMARVKVGACVYCGKPAMLYHTSCTACALKRSEEYRARKERRTV